MGQTSRWVEKLELELIPAGAVTLAELGKNVINSWHYVFPPSTCQRNLCNCIYISLNSWLYILQESRQGVGEIKFILLGNLGK